MGKYNNPDGLTEKKLSSLQVWFEENCLIFKIYS